MASPMQLTKEQQETVDSVRESRKSGGCIGAIAEVDALLSIIDSLPSPTLGKMEWRELALYINDICVGMVMRHYARNYTDSDYWEGQTFRPIISGKEFPVNGFEVDPMIEAKLWVEQTVQSELNSLGSDGRILQAGVKQCVSFAQEVFNDIWPNGEIDGGHLQDLGEKHGLLTPVKVTEPCGDACGCKDFISEVEFAEGHECFKKHSILLGETK